MVSGGHISYWSINTSYDPILPRYWNSQCWGHHWPTKGFTCWKWHLQKNVVENQLILVIQELKLGEDIGPIKFLWSSDLILEWDFPEHQFVTPTCISQWESNISFNWVLIFPEQYISGSESTILVPIYWVSMYLRHLPEHQFVAM